MKALTISQPYASLIADGKKFVENRSWATKYRGPLAIHAGKGTQYMTKAQMLSKSLPIGQIVATANLVACVEVKHPIPADWDKIVPGSKTGITYKAFLRHEYTEGPWGWLLEDIEKLDCPIDIKGQQGLWEWNDK